MAMQRTRPISVLVSGSARLRLCRLVMLTEKHYGTSFIVENRAQQEGVDRSGCTLKLYGSFVQCKRLCLFDAATRPVELIR